LDSDGLYIKVYKSTSLGEFVYSEDNLPSYYNSAQDGYFLFSTESAAKEWQVYQRY
jgi:hypothetical protein